jgi:hypothetical protein
MGQAGPVETICTANIYTDVRGNTDVLLPVLQVRMQTMQTANKSQPLVASANSQVAESAPCSAD